MIKRNILTLVLLLVVGGAAVAVDSSGSAQTQRGKVRQWDYCAINSIGYGENRNKLQTVATITFLTGSGVRTEPILGDEPSPGTYGSIPISVSKAITKLGSDGWEMVGNGNVMAGSTWLGGLFFKRPR
jgi:hypothetical protein